MTRQEEIDQLADTAMEMVDQALAECMAHTTSPDFGAAAVLCTCFKRALLKLPPEQRAQFVPFIAKLLSVAGSR